MCGVGEERKGGGEEEKEAFFWAGVTSTSRGAGLRRFPAFCPCTCVPTNGRDRTASTPPASQLLVRADAIGRPVGRGGPRGRSSGRALVTGRFVRSAARPPPLSSPHL